jgi:hypothetical protein
MPTTFYNTVRVTHTGGNLLTALAGTPADGDSVYLGMSADKYNAGLSMPSIDLLLLNAQAGWSGNLGDPSTGAMLEADFDNAGAGKALCNWAGEYIGLQGGATGVLAYVAVNSVTGSGMVVLKGYSTITEALVESGTLLVLDDADANLVRMNGGNVWLTESTLVTNTFYAKSGHAIIERETTTLDIGAAMVIKKNVAEPLGTVTVGSGGELRLEGLSAIATLLEAFPGSVVDFSRIERPISISGITNRFHAGSTLILPRDPSMVTLATTYRVGGGPNIVVK